MFESPEAAVTDLAKTLPATLINDTYCLCWLIEMDAEEAEVDFVCGVDLDDGESAYNVDVAESLLGVAPAALASRMFRIGSVSGAPAPLHDVLAGRPGHVALMMLVAAEIKVDAAVLYSPSKTTHVKQLTVAVVAKGTLSRREDRMVAY